MRQNIISVKSTPTAKVPLNKGEIAETWDDDYIISVGDKGISLLDGTTVELDKVKRILPPGAEITLQIPELNGKRTLPALEAKNESATTGNEFLNWYHVWKNGGRVSCKFYSGIFNARITIVPEYAKNMNPSPKDLNMKFSHVHDGIRFNGKYIIPFYDNIKPYITDSYKDKKLTDALQLITFKYKKGKLTPKQKRELKTRVADFNLKYNLL